MQHTSNSFNLLNQVQLDINTIENPFNLNLDDLFLLGARVNPKRSFLFISKLLGKHLDVHPDIPKLSGHLLSNLFTKTYENTYFSNVKSLVDAIKTGEISTDIKNELNKRHTLSEEVLFIGFAETATGIGHAVFSAFDNAYYVHTTREEYLDKQSVFDFQEEHSHATEHLCYLTDTKVLDKVSHIVLIDDEITTGNTCLNLIRSLNKLYPNKRYTILSLLDWRTKEQEENYELIKKELGINIKTISVLRGDIELKQNGVFDKQIVEEASYENSTKNYRIIYKPFKNRVKVMNGKKETGSLVKVTGRFGLSSKEAEEIEVEANEIGVYLQSLRTSEHTLCIGHGEFMYIPSRISSYMGEGVMYKSSTRSPIFVSNKDSYPIKDKIQYTLSNGVVNYLYNLNEIDIDEVMMFFENDMDKEILDSIYKNCRSKGITNITFVMV